MAAPRGNKIVVEDSLKPFVTVKDVMSVFGCGIDKAKMIMNNPDLRKFPVGDTYYVTRELWDKFINNLVNHNGLRNLDQGFN